MTPHRLTLIILTSFAATFLTSACRTETERRLFAELTPIDPSGGSDRASVRLLSLISPGFHCPSCLRTVGSVEAMIADWPDLKLNHFVVADGRHTAEEDAHTYAEYQSPEVPVLFDPQGSIRSRLGLSELPLLVGLDSSDRVLFVLPLPNGLNEQDFRTQFLSIMQGLQSEKWLWTRISE